MRRRLLFVIGIVCCTGIILAALSTHQHLRLVRLGFEQESFCAISETVNCDLVNASTYSEVFGVPVAWWGAIYYGLLALMSFFASVSRKQRRATVSIAWFMALAGIPYCIYLAYIAFLVLETVCIECLGMYAVNLFAAVALFFALKIPILRAPSYVWDYAVASFGGTNRLGFKHAAWTHVIVIALIFGTGWLAMLHIQSKNGPPMRSKASVEEQLSAHYVQSIHPIEVQPSWAVWGNPDAKVKLVEFSEFQCPFCRVSCFTVKPYLHQFRKDMAYYFVNYPLDPTCNPELDRPMHPIACFLSKAGICADKRGAFWEYHDELFRNQKKLTKELSLDIAEKDFGWDRDEFQKCISSPETEELLRQEIDVGRRIYIRGTPALFLNGRKIKNWQDKKFIQALVKEEIKRSR